MRKGKYQKAVVKKHRKNKPNILIISLVLLLVAVIGGTVAYLMDTTSGVTNTFTPAEVKITIEEDTTKTTKENIIFTNSDEADAVPVYIRATLVIYWKDAEGNVIPQPELAKVEGGNPGTDWFKVGDIYYYKPKVPVGRSTMAMTDTITVTIPAGSTAKCYIDVRAEAIQADPAEAVADAWKVVKVDNGNLVENT